VEWQDEEASHYAMSSSDHILNQFLYIHARQFKFMFIKSQFFFARISIHWGGWVTEITVGNQNPG
jgi:hypothetical protein